MTIEKIQELTPRQQVVQLVAEDCADVAIAKLADKYKGLKAIDNDSYEVLKKALRDIVSRRTGIDKRRKSLKNDVEKEAKRITALLVDIENPLKAEKDKYEEEAKRIAAEEAAIEAARIAKIQARIAIFTKPLENMHGKTAMQLQEDLHFLRDCIETDTFEYQEFAEHAGQVQQDTLGKLNMAYLDKNAAEKEQARIAEEKAALAAERAALEKEKAELAAAKEIEINAAIGITDFSALNPNNENIIKPIGITELTADVVASGVAPSAKEPDNENIKFEESATSTIVAPNQIITTGKAGTLTIGNTYFTDISSRDLYTEAATVNERMQAYGGSFVKALGVAISKADIHNMRRIRGAFSDYWNQYLNWGK